MTWQSAAPDACTDRNDATRGSQQNTLRDAVVASRHLDAFHRHAGRVVMANIAQTVNVLQAMVLTDPETDALVLTPTYHVFAMNTGHHDADALDVRWRGEVPTSAVDDVEQDRTVVLDLRGRDVLEHSAQVLTGPTLNAHNTAAQPDAVVPGRRDGVRPHPRGLEVDLPAHSYVTVSLDLA